MSLRGVIATKQPLKTLEIATLPAVARNDREIQRTTQTSYLSYFLALFAGAAGAGPAADVLSLTGVVLLFSGGAAGGTMPFRAGLPSCKLARIFFILFLPVLNDTTSFY